MLDFYDVDLDYIKFLKQFDNKIPNIKYDGNNKFVCGVVLNINGIKYYAPISHTIEKQQTNLRIMNGDSPIATIKFSFMFPATDNVIKRRSIKEIAKTDGKYASLLNIELNYCNDNIDKITKKANSVYKIGCNKNHVLNNVCCDFKLLEQKYLEYKN